MTTTGQAQLVRAFVESMPATAWLGIEVLELEAGRATFRLENRPELTFDGTTVQGGLVAVLADYAAVAACGTTMPLGWLVATIGTEAHNIAPASGEQLIARAEVVKTGKRRAIARVDVHNDSPDGDVCLTGLFTATGVPAPAD